MDFAGKDLNLAKLDIDPVRCVTKLDPMLLEQSFGLELLGALGTSIRPFSSVIHMVHAHSLTQHEALSAARPRTYVLLIARVGQLVLAKRRTPSKVLAAHFALVLANLQVHSQMVPFKLAMVVRGPVITQLALEAPESFMKPRNVGIQCQLVLIGFIAMRTFKLFHFLRWLDILVDFLDVQFHSVHVITDEIAIFIWAFFVAFFCLFVHLFVLGLATCDGLVANFTEKWDFQVVLSQGCYRAESHVAVLATPEEGFVVIGVRGQKRLTFYLHCAWLLRFVLLHDYIWDPTDLGIHSVRYLWMLL